MKRLDELIQLLNVEDVSDDNITNLPELTTQRILKRTLEKAGLIKRKQRFQLRIILVAAIAMTLSVAVAAKDIIATVFRSIYKDSSLIVEKYNRQVNASTSNNGITFTIESVLRDDLGYYFFYKMKNEMSPFQGGLVASLTDQVTYMPGSRISSGTARFGGPMPSAEEMDEYSSVWYLPDSKALSDAKSVEIKIDRIVELNINNERQRSDFDISKYLATISNLNAQELLETKAGRILGRKNLDILPYTGSECRIDNIGIVDGSLYIKLITKDYYLLSSPDLQLTDGVNIYTPGATFRSNTENVGTADFVFSQINTDELAGLYLLICQPDIVNDRTGPWQLSFQLPEEKAPAAIILPNIQFGIWNSQWHTDEISITPVSISLNISTVEPASQEENQTTGQTHLRLWMQDGTMITGKPRSGTVSSSQDGRLNARTNFWFTRAFHMENINQIEVSETADFQDIRLVIEPGAYQVQP
ncbi:MAG TPA: hypothetical protein DD727_00140 [Clostridiales bacterium]|nr:hypothetical protein [Clostridiales bacterium]